MNEHVAGCLFGLAIGDALGAPTEFLAVDQILGRFPPHGPTAPRGTPARVTDDTQMMLAVGEALLTAARPYTATTLEEPLRAAFIAWNNSPENNRAPGMTCMRACANLERGLPWAEGRSTARRAAARICASPRSACSRPARTERRPVRARRSRSSRRR